jgi:hypothetical protein
VVPDSSVFTARKLIKMTRSYNKLSVSSLNIIRELKNMKTGYSRMHDISMMKDRSLFKQHCSHVVMTDFSRINYNKINKVKA